MLILGPNKLRPILKNKLFGLCGKKILLQIINACKNAMCFAIIAEECTDKSTKEQMSLCLRFLKYNNNNTIINREEFVGLKHAESVKGAAIT